jgi:hypothetical protein
VHIVREVFSGQGMGYEVATKAEGELIFLEDRKIKVGEKRKVHCGMSYFQTGFSHGPWGSIVSRVGSGSHERNISPSVCPS